MCPFRARNPARMSIDRRTARSLFMSISARGAQACELSGPPLCKVSASAREVTASFPIVAPPFVWRWRRTETPDNELEYRWQVEFGSCNAQAIFEPGEFAFGVQVFKFAGSA